MAWPYLSGTSWNFSILRNSLNNLTPICFNIQLAESRCSFDPWYTCSNSMIARVAAVFSSSRDWKANVLQFAPDYSQQHNQTLQITNTSRTTRHVPSGERKCSLEKMGFTSDGIPVAHVLPPSPSSPEPRPEKDWALCLSLTPSNVHHASSIASAFNLNQWQRWICKTRTEKDVNMTSSHKVMLHVPSECICRKRGWLVKKRYSMRFFCMASTSSRSGGLPSSWSLATNLESSMAPATKCSVSASKSCYRYCGGCRWVSTWIHSLGSTRPSNIGKHTSYQYSQDKIV